MAKYSWFLFLRIITFANGSFATTVTWDNGSGCGNHNFGTAANWDTD